MIIYSKLVCRQLYYCFKILHGSAPPSCPQPLCPIMLPLYATEWTITREAGNWHWPRGGALGYSGGKETWFVPDPYITCPKDKDKITWLLKSVLVLALSYAEAWCSWTSQVVSPGLCGPDSCPQLSTGQLPQKYMPLATVATGVGDWHSLLLWERQEITHSLSMTCPHLWKPGHYWWKADSHPKSKSSTN